MIARTRSNSGMANESGDEPVGYCRPPKHSWFKPGHTGNPNGRPKAKPQEGSVVATLLDRLNETVTVVEGGRRFKMTTIDVVWKRMIQNAMKGDISALAILSRILTSKVALAAIPLCDCKSPARLQRVRDELRQKLIRSKSLFMEEEKARSRNEQRT
jgi:hypothetical protein